MQAENSNDFSSVKMDSLILQFFVLYIATVYGHFFINLLLKSNQSNCKVQQQ